ncbi:methylated-DNA--[protein]-cysteine S-methyltransferase [Pseudomonas sp. NA-150]|uniref:methylated-DNA--[protein]-cysteine S-methyltransferase n=1 Tax=Pseudomonas sp. NA-150 TaxID=3367525 RepID=UPI0037C7BD9F
MSAGYWVPSPLGDIALRVEDEVLTGVFFVGQKYYPSLMLGAGDAQAPRVVQQAHQELAEFFRGERRVFEVPFRAQGTPFQRAVWEELSRIPYGEIVSYGDMARNMGLSPGHSRAVGSANGKNPISIIVPCHRVIGSSGDLTGYAGGVDRKRALLSLENAIGRPAGFEFELTAN